MRLDKYLKVSQLIKRRSLAKEAASGNRILLNGKDVKPSSNVIEGDILEVRYAEKRLKVKVLSTSEYTSKKEANGMYEVISNE